MRHGLIFAAVILTILCSSCKAEENKKMEGTAEIEKMQETERTVKGNVCLEGRNVGGLKESEVRDIIRVHSERVNTGVVNAVLNEKSWKISREKDGKSVDAEATLQKLLNAKEGEKVRLVLKTLKPQVTAEALRKNIVEIASYTTPLLDRRHSRVNNIDLASEKINGYKLQPGEEFSFNKAVGRRTEAKGYEEAPIIIKTPDGPEKKLGVGGGICQLSSTIYNAAEECGLEITERHLHSKNVGYVPKGEDATVAYGSIDLKFKNSRSHPIMLRVHLKRKSLTVKVYENRNST